VAKEVITKTIPILALDVSIEKFPKLEDRVEFGERVMQEVRNSDYHLYVLMLHTLAAGADL
jgi:hypothetical protein